MSNFFIDKILASGKARVGYYTASGGQMILQAPEGAALIITKMRLSAFADLPSGSDFLSIGQDIARYTWHQLRVNTTMGISVFHVRHNIIPIRVDPDSYSIPDGWMEWKNLYIPSDGNIIFDLSHAPDMTSWVTSIGPLPGSVRQPKPIDPPAGYSQEGFPGAVQTVDLLGVNTAAPYKWEHRPFGTYSDPTTGNSSAKLNWVINSETALNDPLIGPAAIPLGELTIPLLEVEYIAFNKPSDWNFPGAI